MLDQSVREALQAELEHLQARHAKDAERIKALAAILDPDDKLEMFQLHLPIDTKAVAAPSNGERSLAGVGLRQAIRTVLAQHPSGLPPRELAIRINQAGYKPGGKLTTQQLLYGELNRLKGKTLEKRGKRYRLLPVSTQQEGAAL
jgi:hypothetical protein